MENSHIQWTDSTWNPHHGCKKISEGCKYCYMYRDKEKYGQDATVIQRSKTKFKDPLTWKDPRLIFTCSWSDFFIEEADGWRPEAWDIIRQTPHHTYQILTKRPERMMKNLPPDWGDGWDNVWLGVTIENQETIARAAILAKVPAKTRFISAEPLLEEVNFLEKVEGRLILDDFHWIILGGESGNETGKYL
jgi:protein gp37